MNTIQKLKYIKENYGVTYTFIADKIGTTYNRLYRFTLPKDNDNYRDLSYQVKIKLNEYINERID
ncbi:hypothetical protein DWV12_11235 [Clostridium botulinum]|uniref:hypothetical protein n=1 Tax=Clostridium botulinum TaxID=1491 RepID=UPI00217DEAF2|nr:hypothetical protein [Clostridium botulinum]MCS6107944.1 hypothetical protein [Clostridium botulinum]